MNEDNVEIITRGRMSLDNDDVNRNSTHKEDVNEDSVQMIKRRRICLDNLDNDKSGDSYKKSRRMSLRGENNGRNSSSSLTTGLIDLNADCLRMIFAYLEVNDFVYLAEANLTDCEDDENVFTALTNVTTHPYQSAIRDAFLKVGTDDFDNFTDEPAYFNFDTKILKYFGSLFSKISLHYHPEFCRHSGQIEEAIFKYCAATLLEIHIYNSDECAFEDIDQPFAQLKTIKLTEGCLSEPLNNFNQWFPSLESLTLARTEIKDSECMEKAFPNLKTLNVSNKRLCQCNNIDEWWERHTEMSDYGLTNDSLKKFIELNRQLESLSLAYDKIHNANVDGSNDGYSILINSRLLAFINNKLTSLQSLDLDLRELSTLDTSSAKIRFKNLSKLSIRLRQIDQLRQMNVMSDQVTNLSLSVREHSIPNNYRLLSEFVSCFRNVEFLWIEYWPIDIYNHDFVNMIKSLHSLKTLKITLDALNESDLLSYLLDCIHQFNQINTFCIKCYKINGQNHQSVLNGLMDSDFLKGIWKGTKGFFFEDFIFEKI